jgi:hypothetical protein
MAGLMFDPRRCDLLLEGQKAWWSATFSDRDDTDKTYCLMRFPCGVRLWVDRKRMWSLENRRARKLVEAPSGLVLQDRPPGRLFRLAAMLRAGTNDEAEMRQACEQFEQPR